MSDLPPWNTKEAREILTKRFYNMTPAEFEHAYLTRKLEFHEHTLMFKTLMRWYPDLAAKREALVDG